MARDADSLFNLGGVAAPATVALVAADLIFSGVVGDDKVDSAAVVVAVEPSWSRCCG